MIIMRGEVITGKAGARRGQAWSMDYAISLTLFIIALIIVVNLLSSSITTNDFKALSESGTTFSEEIMSQGYPPYWTINSIIAPGLLTDGELSIVKTSSLIKNPPSFRYYYSIIGHYLNGTIIDLGGDCQITNKPGAVSMLKSSYDRELRIAYFYKDSNYLLLNLTEEGAYTTSDFPQLKDELRKYDLIILENPDLLGNPDDELLDSEKEALLEDFVKKGGELIIIGETGLNLLNLHLFETSDPEECPVLYDDKYLNQTIGSNFSTTTTHYLINKSEEPTDAYNDSYQSIIGCEKGDLAGRIKLGDGHIYYYGSLTATNSLGDPINKLLEKGIENNKVVSVLNCYNTTGITFPESKNRVVINRMTSYKGAPVIMKMIFWS